MKSIMIFVTIATMVAFGACKDKPTKKIELKKEVVKPIVEDVKDTLAVPEPEVVEEVIPVQEDKYFLIAASFQSRDYADKYQRDLENQGYKSQVIVRPSRANEDFYKVSYKAFHDREQAFKELAMERKQIDKENVWLLIK